MILRASCGLNYEEFVEFLNVIAKQRMWTITKKVIDTASEESDLNNKSSVFEDWRNAINILEREGQQSLTDYCRYDLVKVRECLISLKDEHSFNELQNKDLQIRVDDLLQEIHTTLESERKRTTAFSDDSIDHISCK